MKAEIRWIGKTSLAFIFLLCVKVVILIPLIIALLHLNIMKPFIALGILGLVIADYGIFLRYNREMQEITNSTIKIIGLPILFIAGISASYVCFFISVILGTYIYGIVQLGLLFTLFWSNFEHWLSEIKWFLSPSVLVASIIIITLKYIESQSILNQDMFQISPNGKLDRILWEKTRNFCKQHKAI